ncbi:MAG: hypothetical protein HYW89_01685 [Candidatus Sungiibacteriota bacterium]|uniref:Uncharacterized protein n=1 Tax=Candidatus Sungiibacteriota bacterium TaxID=2750080 RepID=A0A7T5RK68_9BACT|nr:MAG: hypothetical protein HYW89_01685 [Candidatus Sungbacteria bacterium]
MKIIRYRTLSFWTATTGLVLIAAVFAIPFFVSAQGIIPQCPDRIIVDSAGKELQRIPNVCTACDLFNLSQSVLNFVWRLSAVGAALMLGYGGFLMIVPGIGGEKSAAMYEKGKKVLTNTVIGLVIIFFAWLAVDTIIKVLGGKIAAGFGENTEYLGGGGFEFGPWNRINCSPPETRKVVASPATKPTTPTPAPIPSPTTSPTLNHAEALGIFAANRIKIESKGNCDDRNSAVCTSLEGLRRTTLNRVVLFKLECNCEVTVSGGTETGHEAGQFSHASGYKVDIKRTAAVDSYITRNYRNAGKRSDGAQIFVAPDGAEFARESSHWDVRGWDVTVR